MSDYRVRITVRNARLLRAIEKAGHRPGPQFAATVGIEYGSQLLPYLNLTRSPLNQEGLLRVCAWALCDYLGAAPSDLWSDAQLQALERNASGFDIDETKLQELIAGVRPSEDPMAMASRNQAARLLHSTMGLLSAGEAQVIYARYFGDCTLEQVAQQFNTSRERIRKIEMTAMKKLRKASRSSRGSAGASGLFGGITHA